MIKLQVQQTDINTGTSKILMSIETTEERKDWMTNELYLMYEDLYTQSTTIKVMQVHEA